MTYRRKYPTRPDVCQDKHVGALNELQASLWLLKQGYDVFRNVSAHGLVDIVAMKDGIVRKFDVKALSGGLSAEQVALNVELIRVSTDGVCEIVRQPTIMAEARAGLN